MKRANNCTIILRLAAKEHNLFSKTAVQTADITGLHSLSGHLRLLPRDGDAMEHNIYPVVTVYDTMDEFICTRNKHSGINNGAAKKNIKSERL